MNTKANKDQAGVPLGGTTGQALVKLSNADNDVGFGTPAGSSLYAVNADETVSTWWTTQITAPFTGTQATESPWTISGNCVQYANGSNSDSNGNFEASTTNGLFSTLTTNSQTLVFNSIKDWRLKFRLANNPGTGVSPVGGGVIWAFAGFARNIGGTTNGDITNTQERYGFAFYNGRLYTIVADGTSVSSFDTGVYVALANKGFEMVYNAGVSIDFYIDGALVNTESLLTQTSNVVKLCHTGTNGSGGGSGGIISSFVFSEEV